MHTKMAANRFATNTTLTLLLTYALLEWILILLLLLHSLFSYTILQFSLFFRLIPPCFCCSTIHPNLHNCQRHSTPNFQQIPISNDNEPPTTQETAELIGTDDNSPSLQIQHLDFCLDYSGHTLVPIEDRGKEKKKPLQKAFIDIDINEEPQCLMEIEEDENSLVFCPKPNNLTADEFESLGVFPLIRWPSADAGCIQELADTYLEAVASEEVARESSGNEADVSIGTEIPDLDITDLCSNEDRVENPNICNKKDDVELHSTAIGMEESEKVPDTPTSVDSLNHLHKKILMLEKPDFITAEDLVEGSDLEQNDEAVTIECLKSALKAKRKALRVLYTELEEERSASAVAASQTMAMINRLQEEKAAVQMEALQYQRMMEEQAEYDQEALQMLNEVMVKREREKVELERELEGCKKKLLEYEARAERRGGFSSEDSDGVSIDLNRVGICGYVDHECTPVEAVVDLEESLAEFEDERISILEQLKSLEGRLLTMHNSQNGHPSMDVRERENGHSNGYAMKAMINGNPGQLRGHKGKSLLPLFDAMSDENGYSLEHESCKMDSKKVAIGDEMDCLYERLQALEADQEFLKHCIGSLRKGDKGTDLLREILQHLRDLRGVELRIRTLSEGCKC